MDIAPGIVIDTSRGRRKQDVNDCVVGVDALIGYGHPVGQQAADKVVGVWEL